MTSSMFGLPDPSADKPSSSFDKDAKTAAIVGSTSEKSD
jgi:hypothetical protein